MTHINQATLMSRRYIQVTCGPMVLLSMLAALLVSCIGVAASDASEQVRTSTALAWGGESAWPWGPKLFPISSATGDVTGDQVDDIVILLGEKENGQDLYATEHTLIVFDGQQHRAHQLPLGPDSGGYSSRLELVQLNGDGALEVLLRFPTGGSGGVVRPLALAVSGKVPRVMFGSLDRTTPLSVEISITNRLPGPYAHLVARSGVKRYEFTFPLDPTQLGGQDKEPSGAIDPFGLILTEDLHGDSKSEIVAYQKVWVQYHANTVAYVRSTWKWNGSDMRLAGLAVLTPDEAFAELEPKSSSR